jgi:hypothetical protein
MSTRLAIALMASVCFGQTRVHPCQIRDWRQVSPALIAPARMRPGIDLTQMRFGKGWLDMWKNVASSYSYYRVAVVVEQQPNPILITCDNATVMGGVRCDESWPFWFGEL